MAYEVKYKITPYAISFFLRIRQIGVHAQVSNIFHQITCL